MRHLTIFISFLLSFHFGSTQTFHAVDFDEYENYITLQTKHQARLDSGHKTILADFRTTYATDYKEAYKLFPGYTDPDPSTLKDTVFDYKITGRVLCLGNLKRNDTVVYRVFNYLEEEVSTTLDSTFKKRRAYYSNYILDTQGNIVGEIVDYGNHTFQYIQNEKLLYFSSKHAPGKISLMDPFSNNLTTHFISPTNSYIFAEVKYFADPNEQIIRAH